MAPRDSLPPVLCVELGSLSPNTATAATAGLIAVLLGAGAADTGAVDGAAAGVGGLGSADPVLSGVAGHEAALAAS